VSLCILYASVLIMHITKWIAMMCGIVLTEQILVKEVGRHIHAVTHLQLSLIFFCYK